MFLCVDIGGTNTLIGLGNGDFEEKRRIKSREFLSDIEAFLKDVISESDYSIQDLEEIAVAAAGPVDRDEGIFYPPNISDDPELSEVQIREPLESFAEVSIINDCTAAVRGEYEYGESAENMLYITVSSGIGLGAIFDGDVVEGSDGNFGEVGHMKVEEEMECGCGGKGHWEAYSSGNRLPIMAEKLFDAEYDDARKLFEAYESGDPSAEKAISKMQSINADAISNLITLYNPDKIVFGGPVALNHSETVIYDIMGEIEEKSVNRMPDMVLAALGEHSVLHGLRAHCNRG